MKFSNVGLLLFMVFGMNMISNAQSLNRADGPEYDANYSYFSAILLNGEPLIKKDSPDGPLNLPKMGMKGKLSVAAIDRTGGKMRQVQSIGFKVGIKNWRSNTIWMFSEETLYEVDLEELEKKCEMGDQLIFMTVDRKYQLPRHVVMGIKGGC